jgi:hypothetical protein
MEIKQKQKQYSGHSSYQQSGQGAEAGPILSTAHSIVNGTDHYGGKNYQEEAYVIAYFTHKF